MLKAADPWYVHAILYAVIAILVIILIKVAILDPKEIVAVEKYNKSESRLRMDNIKEAEILWEQKFGNFTDDLEGLVQFIKQDPFVDSVVNAFDSLTMKPANPFNPLTHGEFLADSLLRTPRSGSLYILQIDTSVTYDTTINRRGNVTKIDTTVTLGTRYYLEDPDGYGSVGSLNSDALKNTASWE
ncbi:MAG: hypothetical protein KJO12_06040 [Ignavibacteria bacterium]|nr:hypothetical protein [Ignavibacteria bacterium]